MANKPRTKRQDAERPTPSVKIKYLGIFGGDVQNVQLAQSTAVMREILERQASADDDSTKTK